MQDIYSITLTVVSSLLRKYKIDPRDIGRLEVGTETLLDKSKSVKSVLMQLFASVNTNVEGVDNINGCYGGTNALLNALSWIESPAWDGRMAIVVAGDIAVYNRGVARPTGGAGSVAMLIGPDAPISLQTGVRGSYMQHEYDFFKPDFRSEYPIVDGHYSQQCYSRALDACYGAYRNREDAVSRSNDQLHINGITNAGIPGCLNGENGVKRVNGDSTVKTNKSSKNLLGQRFDYMCFHSPTSKLVAKSWARLAYNDYLAAPDHEVFKGLDPSLGFIDYQDSLVDRRIEKAFMGLTAESFARCVQPGMTCPNLCGNMYTASLYSSLASLISSLEPVEFLGKSVGMFSYGSGLASTLFSLKVVGDTSEMRSALNLGERLEDRAVIDPSSFEKVSHLTDDFASLCCAKLNHKLCRLCCYVSVFISALTAIRLEVSEVLSRGPITLRALIAGDDLTKLLDHRSSPIKHVEHS